ncbi:MAG: rod shape-determining protein MreC [Chloroflexi bacterium]|nr:rod shape-determining protein MreC [Chloroflexota bacterium]
MDELRIGRVPASPGQRLLPGWSVVGLALVVVVLAVLPGLRLVLQDSAIRLIAPLQAAVAQTLVSTGNLVGTVSQAGDLAAQNQSYREQIEQLQTSLAHVRELEAENRDLRGLLGLRDRLPIGKLIPAQVVARDPLALVQAVMIDRGRDDGVAISFPVVTDRGVVGRIVEIHASSAKALLLTDVNSAVAVQTRGSESQASGLVRGAGDGRLILEYVPQEESLRQGDAVITSGVGGTFPPGLVIGTVTQIRQTDVGVFQQALVEPAVRARSLERVYVLGKSPAS